MRVRDRRIRFGAKAVKGFPMPVPVTESINRMYYRANHRVRSTKKMTASPFVARMVALMARGMR